MYAGMFCDLHTLSCGKLPGSDRSRVARKMRAREGSFGRETGPTWLHCQCCSRPARRGRVRGPAPEKKANGGSWGCSDILTKGCQKSPSSTLFTCFPRRRPGEGPIGGVLPQQLDHVRGGGMLRRAGHDAGVVHHLARGPRGAARRGKGSSFLFRFQLSSPPVAAATPRTTARTSWRWT